jgi:hypothetical protein
VSDEAAVAMGGGAAVMDMEYYLSPGKIEKSVNIRNKMDCRFSGG